MDMPKKLDLTGISVGLAERAKEMAGDMEAIGLLVEAGNARAPIRAGVEEILQTFERRIAEQQKLIDLIRRAMAAEVEE